MTTDSRTTRRTALAGGAALALAAALGAGFAPAALAQQQQTLRVSAIPDESPTELQRKFKPLGDYLKKETGLDVQFTPVSDYAAVVEGLASGKIDLAWLGGFTFVQAKLRTNGGATPIVQRAEDEKFTSKFIVPEGSDAKTLADLKGRTFAFGAPSSTSGSLMPRHFLLQAGIVPERDFKAVAYSGAHDATVAFVAAGRAEAGVLNASVWDKLKEANNPNAEPRARARHHAHLLRLQLDGAPRPRRRADEEDRRRLPQARPGQPGAEGNPRPAARLEVRADQGGELRRHRGGGAGGGAAQMSRARAPDPSQASSREAADAARAGRHAGR